ncbi:MAG: cellulase family glycosylhydrolase, partial [Pseudomonadota bacterium]
LMVEPQAHGARLLGLWQQIAEHFADRADSLWFETLNEPFGALQGAYLLKLQQAIVTTIRSSNPERLVIVMGEEWSSIRSLATNIPPPDPNIVYSFHYYDPFDFTHQQATWLGDATPKGTRGWGRRADRQALARDARIAERFVEQVGHPVFLGEFGVNDPVTSEDRVRYLGAVAKAFGDRGVAWCVWSYANTFALYSDEGGWDEAALEALGMAAR